MSRYIETSEATAVIADYFDLICDTEYVFNEAEILRRLNNSAVDAVPVRHGKWIFKPTFPNDDSEFPMGSLVCSICGSHHSNETPCNYCDNCGARMDEENDTKGD